MTRREMTDASFKILIYVTITSHTVDSSRKYTCTSLVKNQALANERGTLCVDAICDRITIQNPVKLVYCCRTPPYLTCIFRKKPSTLARVQHFTNL